MVCARCIDGVNADIVFPVLMQGLPRDVLRGSHVDGLNVKWVLDMHLRNQKMSIFAR